MGSGGLRDANGKLRTVLASACWQSVADDTSVVWAGFWKAKFSRQVGFPALEFERLTTKTPNWESYREGRLRFMLGFHRTQMT